MRANAPDRITTVTPGQRPPDTRKHTVLPVSIRLKSTEKTPACVSMRAFLQPISARIYFGKTASHRKRARFVQSRGASPQAYWMSVKAAQRRGCAKRAFCGVCFLMPGGLRGGFCVCQSEAIKGISAACSVPRALLRVDGQHHHQRVQGILLLCHVDDVGIRPAEQFLGHRGHLLSRRVHNGVVPFHEAALHPPAVEVQRERRPQEREFLANTFAYALLLPYDLTYVEKKAYQRKSVNLPIDYSSWIIHLRDLSQLPEYHVVLAYEKVKLLHMSHMRHLQQEMKDALEFYANLAVHSASSDEFWGKYNAHVTFNALFYNGIVSEKERTAENKVAVNKTPENKVLDPSIFDDAPQLFQWAKMLQYACWYFASQKSVTTYRICRKVDADALLAQNRTISFTSTSYKILSNRADKISNPVLLIFHISPRTPCVDIAAALGKDYSEKSEEQEIILPPFLSLQVSTSHSTSFENLEKLVDNTLRSRLVGIYDIDVDEGDKSFSESKAPESRKSLEYLNDENREAGRRVLTAINEGVDPVESDVDAYLLWKEGFRRMVWKFSQEAWNEIVDR